ISTPQKLDEIISLFNNIYDIERLMTRVVYGTVNPREIRSLGCTISNLPNLKKITETFTSSYLMAINDNIDTLEEISSLIDNAISDEPPIAMKDGGVIKQGFNEELDNYRDLCFNAKEYIAKIEQREKEKTGISKLKIGYNRIFGYYIEVTNSFLSQVPETYIRKQTLSNCERYITQELKDLEAKVLSANDKILALELEIFDEVRKFVAQKIDIIQSTATAISKLDFICSLSIVALENNYVCPDITLDGKISIKDGRHPVVEKIIDTSMFVPNDTILDTKNNKMMIITGPNMAGKSTYMRQVAVITIMAQIGSFVPATSASISICDKIFTRVGASDDLASGQSTFMVEMSEVAHILKTATPQSLVILDEIGRGTSTFDGMSIAKAVVGHIVEDKKLSCKTLFATHYHELTAMENEYSGIKNYNIAVKKRGDDITFLRKIIRGGADESFGIEVAKLAGVPQVV
ncbi:MAG: DNA mismatch repair protein MutS, partial [Oscillospiraceae bacterium]